MEEVIRKLLDPFYNFLSSEYQIVKQNYQDKKEKGIRTYNKIISYISVLILFYFLKEIIAWLAYKFDKLLKSS
jgi:hypothetical protein